MKYVNHYDGNNNNVKCNDNVTDIMTSYTVVV